MSEIHENDEQLALLRNIAASVHELLLWTRVARHDAVRNVLQAALDSDEKRLVYHFSDGKRGVADIQDLTGVNVRFVSEWGQQWEKIGIVQPSTVSKIKGRRQKVFDLQAFDIALPDVSD
jgi:hypothetical protein